MEWSTEKPIVTGFYWYTSVKKPADGVISDNDFKIVHVQVDRNGNIVARIKNIGKIKPIEIMHGRWMGPI